MKTEEIPDWILVSMALDPLRIIRDWRENESLSVFSGDPEKQFEALYEGFKKVITEAPLLHPAPQDDSLRTKWLAALEVLEAKMAQREMFPVGRGNKPYAS